MKASVIGGGSWGSAFALQLGREKISTRLWIREKDIYEQTRRERENSTFLPGGVFPPHVTFHNDLQTACDGAEILFIAVPSKFCRDVYEQILPYLEPGSILVSLTKGLEEGSLKRMTQVMQEVFSEIHPRIAVISGPSFAREVSANHPTAVVVSTKDMDLATQIQHFISSPYFRAYTSEDIIGVEISGALKNVIAIATGITDGLNFGSNSIAALITRGLAEITRLGLKLGARLETFAGLAGIGDLVLTCTGQLSRNRHIGYELGRGKSLNEIVSQMKMIAEGITTTRSCHELARKENVEMPISQQVYEILYNGKDPRSALKDLMARTLKDEYTSLHGAKHEK